MSMWIQFSEVRGAFLLDSKAGSNNLQFLNKIFEEALFKREKAGAFLIFYRNKPR